MFLSTTLIHLYIERTLQCNVYVAETLLPGLLEYGGYFNILQGQTSCDPKNAMESFFVVFSLAFSRVALWAENNNQPETRLQTLMLGLTAWGLQSCFMVFVSFGFLEVLLDIIPKCKKQENKTAMKTKQTRLKTLTPLGLPPWTLQSWLLAFLFALVLSRSFALWREMQQNLRETKQTTKHKTANPPKPRTLPLQVCNTCLGLDIDDCVFSCCSHYLQKSTAPMSNFLAAVAYGKHGCGFFQGTFCLVVVKRYLTHTPSTKGWPTPRTRIPPP